MQPTLKIALVGAGIVVALAVVARMVPAWLTRHPAAPYQPPPDPGVPRQ